MIICLYVEALKEEAEDGEEQMRQMKPGEEEAPTQSNPSDPIRRSEHVPVWQSRRKEQNRTEVIYFAHYIPNAVVQQL